MGRPAPGDPEKALAALADEDYVGDKVLAAVPELYAWMVDTVFGYVSPGAAAQAWVEEGTVYINLYTNEHVYRISARRPDTEDAEGYLGCIGWTQYKRPGETHTRGNDLHDGPYDKETWSHIVGDMLSYEIVELARSAPRGDPNREGAKDE
jgi:hypothetical protein